MNRPPRNPKPPARYDDGAAAALLALGRPRIVGHRQARRSAHAAAVAAAAARAIAAPVFTAAALQTGQSHKPRWARRKHRQHASPQVLRLAPRDACLPRRSTCWQTGGGSHQPRLSAITCTIFATSLTHTISFTPPNSSCLFRAQKLLQCATMLLVLTRCWLCCYAHFQGDCGRADVLVHHLHIGHSTVRPSQMQGQHNARA